jgi:ArsR family transcriptional regulator, lead/cadmium/zinc/bismuth-responsive transcriptional repressor
MTETRTWTTTCSPGPALAERPLITAAQADRLARIFQVLANDSRLRLLHALARAGELCVTDLAAAIDMRPQAVSNQLQRLVDRAILAARRDGNRVHYRIEDPCVTSLVELALCLTEGADAAP